MKWRETTDDAIRMNVHIDAGLHKQLKVKAALEEKSMAYLVNELLHEIVQLHRDNSNKALVTAL